MKYYLIYILPLFFLAALAAGCSDLQSDITQIEKISYHGDGMLNPSSPNFHGSVVKNLKWDMTQCQTCHGTDLSGGKTGVDCKSCHTSAEGPKACNTCHGSFADPSRIAPPRDINGNSATSFRGVGAHAQHLYENILGAKVNCSTCHNLPQDVYAAGHMVNDELPAEVMLKENALLFGAGNAAYDYASGNCANSYCHGNFEFSKDSADATNQFAYASDKMTGLSKTVNWTKVNQGEAFCGSCHGLPPEGHITAGITLNTCYQCHQGVVDENGNIVDKNKHINGVKNARGN